MAEQFIQNYRHEYKYLIHPSTYYKLRETINKVMLKDKNAGIKTGYHIRSLYFDDIYNTSFTEKTLGKNTRMKYRVRIYNFSDQVIKMEIKEKYNDYIKKKSAAINRLEYEKLLNSDVSFLHNSNNFVKERFYYEMRNNLLQPKVIVDYYREAFILPYNQIRITFDKNLSAALPTTDIFNSNLNSVQVGQEYALILEIKYNNFLPNYIRTILEMHDLTRIAVSKYVICREYINR